MRDGLGGRLERRRNEDDEYYGSARKRRHENDEDEEDERDFKMKRSLASTVTLPVIDTKSREEKMEELAKSEKTEVKTRNRRMFSNLLAGTLRQFQKEESNKNTTSSEQKQAEKLNEINKRLEEQKQEDKAKAIEERKKQNDERRKREIEIKDETRKRALMQYAEQKIEHYKLLSNCIQTQAKPVLFFLPAKHTVRSLELLKNSQKIIEGLIDSRQKALELELENDHPPRNDHDDSVKSTVQRRVSRRSGSVDDRDKKNTSSGRNHGDRSYSHSDDDEPASENGRAVKVEDDELRVEVVNTDMNVDSITVD